MKNSNRYTGPTTPVVKRLLLIALLAAPLGAGLADPDLDESGMRDHLETVFPGFTPDRVRKSAMAGLYEVLYGTEVLYVSLDGRHLVRGGELFDVTEETNLTEVARSHVRRRLLEQYSSDNMVVFEANDRRTVLTVVTDIDCPYCRQLHQQVPELNRQGVEIRYLFYPRAGLDSPSYRKSVSVWCANDRKQALTQAKALQSIAERTCANPINQHMALSDKLGVVSTPSLYLPDGMLIRGYYPADKLLALLAQN